MADINLSPYTAEQQAMDRRRKMAEAMQQQAVLPIEMPTMPGVAVSPYAGLVKLLQSYIAGKNIEKSDAEQKAYESATMEDFAKILRNSGKTETIPGEITTPAITGQYPEKQNTLPTGEAYPAVDISAGAMPITPSSAEVRAPDRQVPLLTADALNNPTFMKTSAGRMMLAQALLQQKSQEQAAAKAAQAAALQVHPLAAGGALVQNGRVIAERAKEETFHPPVTQIDPVTGMPQTVAFSNLGTRKVIDTAGAYTPDQWNSMPMADKAKLLFDQYKFGNLTAEQLVQAGQKNAQLGQELQKLQFETGKGGPGPVSISRNAPMRNLLNPAPVGIPAINPAATPAVNAQPVVAPGSQVAPVVNQALAPVGKKPYQPLNFVSKLQTPDAFAAETNADKTIAPEIKKSMINRYRSGYPAALADEKAAATPPQAVAPVPVATGEQPPAGLSPKAQQQWMLDQAKIKTEADKAEQKKARNLEQMPDLISSAKAILQGNGGVDAQGQPIKTQLPTQSYGGAAVDVLGGLIGKTPQGAAQADRLKVIGGAMVMAMPRMEGPQSDADVRLYREMAGRVGDETVSIQRRLAALDEVEKLYSKYNKTSGWKVVK